MVPCRSNRTGRNIVTGLDQRQATTTTGLDYYYYYHHHHCNYYYYYYNYYYWLGLDKIYRLLQFGNGRLRIEVFDSRNIAT